MLTVIDSYPQVYNLGHKALAFLFSNPVLVQEKIDGSQFSFGLFAGLEGGELRMRSKGCKVTVENPGMFRLAVETVTKLAVDLTPGYVYRAEFLAKPKHNVLAYDRVPKANIIIYDIQIGIGDFLGPVDAAAECQRLGLEYSPVFEIDGILSDARLDWFNYLLDTKSCLGGQKIEGIVIKNYERFGFDGKPLFGKYVSEAFKEIHTKEWKNQNPGGADIIDLLTARYRSEARWMKAVQHVKERGELENSPRDIGLLFKEVSVDLVKECTDEIKQILFDWAWKRKLSRSITAGMAEWYKQQLAAQQFDRDQADIDAAVSEGMAYCCEIGHPEAAQCPHDAGHEHGGEA